jgi:hypothetical protein
MKTDRDLDTETLRRLLTYLEVVLDEDDTPPSPNKPRPAEVDAMIAWLDAFEATPEPAQ